MPSSFHENKTINVLLFILKCLGGSANIRKLYLLLYFADTKHLAKYGGLITGDTYIAMKNGPTPLNTLALYRQLKKKPWLKSINRQQKLALSIDENLVATAHISADTAFLAQSEVESLFEAIHEHKDTPLDALAEKARSKAWESADASGEITPVEMAAENGATPDMIRYIEICYIEETNSFAVYEQTTEEE